MISDEIIEAYLSGEFDNIFSTQEEFTLSEAVDHHCGIVLNEYGVFAVEAVYFPLDRSVSTLDITQEDGADLGLITLIKGKVIDDFGQLSLSEFLAYLSDVPRELFANPGYVFKKDYFISAQGQAEEYIQRYFNTAPIWGQYTHSPPPLQRDKIFSAIVALDNIALPSIHHREAFSRYVHAKNPLERYLRLYHCIELLFDTIIVLKIKKLGPDIRDFSAIMTEHGRGELDRLKAIASSHLTDPEAIAKCFVCSVSFLNTSTKVFQDFSKEGNPFARKSDSSKWSDLVTALQKGHFSEADFRVGGLLKNTGYAELVAKTAIYWIYRIRCAIAHSRVGEFILEDRDQAFITDFAEPLLLEFVRQIFRSPALHDLLP